MIDEEGEKDGAKREKRMRTAKARGGERMKIKEETCFD